MYELNLRRLMDGCCVEIDYECFDELMDLLITMRVDLNTLNIDNLWVNGCQFLAYDDTDNFGGVIFHTTEEGIYTIRMECM